MIINNLVNGFVYSWEYLDDWIFTDSEDFTRLLSLARSKANELLSKDKRKFYEKLIYIIGAVGAAAVGVVAAILISGRDEPDTGPGVDTIPSFPPPPGEQPKFFRIS